MQFHSSVRQSLKYDNFVDSQDILCFCYRFLLGQMTMVLCYWFLLEDTHLLA